MNSSFASIRTCFSTKPSQNIRTCYPWLNKKQQQLLSQNSWNLSVFHASYKRLSRYGSAYTPGNNFHYICTITLSRASPEFHMAESSKPSQDFLWLHCSFLKQSLPSAWVVQSFHVPPTQMLLLCLILLPCPLILEPLGGDPITFQGVTTIQDPVASEPLMVNQQTHENLLIKSIWPPSRAWVL